MAVIRRRMPNANALATPDPPALRTGGVNRSRDQKIRQQFLHHFIVGKHRLGVIVDRLKLVAADRARPDMNRLPFADGF